MVVRLKWRRLGAVLRNTSAPWQVARVTALARRRGNPRDSATRRPAVRQPCVGRGVPTTIVQVRRLRSRGLRNGRVFRKEAARGGEVRWMGATATPRRNVRIVPVPPVNASASGNGCHCSPHRLDIRSNDGLRFQCPTDRVVRQGEGGVRPRPRRAVGRCQSAPDSRLRRRFRFAGIDGEQTVKQKRRGQFSVTFAPRVVAPLCPDASSNGRIPELPTPRFGKAG